MKRKPLSLIIIMLLVGILFSCSVEAKKKPSNKELNSAYLQFISSNIKSSVAYYMIDLNRDKVLDCIVTYDPSPRYSRICVLTYKKNTVVVMLNTTVQFDVRYNKKSRQLCLETSSGAMSYSYKVYKIKSNSAVLSAEYRQRQKWQDYNMHFYKGNKEIAEKKFRSVEKKMKKWKNVDPVEKGVRIL